VYRSKIDAWLVIILVSVPAVLLDFILDGIGVEDRLGTLLELSVVVAVLALILWLYWSTRYTISGDFLLVKSGPFSWVIPIEDITSIEPTRNAMSSPALSLDRLLINYGHGSELMISPKDRARFMTELKKHLKPGAGPLDTVHERKPNV
jgi:hypothetical protein